MSYVGKKVHIYFKDGDDISGTLGYANEFSRKYGYRKPKYFYIGNIMFKVSHVRIVKESKGLVKTSPTGSESEK